MEEIMPWIRKDTVLGRHRKTRQLMERLSLSRAEAVGHLTLLWDDVLEQQENGILDGWTPAMIAQAAHYTRDADEFYEALVEYRWIDTGPLRIHDWLDHAGPYLASKYRSNQPERLQEIATAHGWTFTGSRFMKNSLNSPRPSPGSLKTDHSQSKARQIDKTEKTDSDPQTKDRLTPEAALEAWNTLAAEVGLSKVISLSEKRRKGVLLRGKEKAFDLHAVFSKIRESNFLQGKVPRNDDRDPWQVDFDFVFCSANNYVKILEGKYRNKGTAASQPKKVDPLQFIRGKK
jgi:hypothetical protein